MNLYRKLAAVFGRHDALDVLHNARNKTAVIAKLFRAIGDIDAVLFADKFIMSSFVNVLEAPPATDIVN